MKLSELAEYCKTVDCTECEKENYCISFTSRIENITPIGLINLVEDDEDILEA